MRVVLDNNVLVSAAVTPLGNPGAIYQAWRRSEFELVVSDPIFAELTRALDYPRIVRRTGWSEAERDDYLKVLSENGFHVSPGRELNTSRDPADNRIIEAAAAGGADYIVSGDNDLLVLGEFEGIAIVSPARFLAILRTASPH